MWGRYLKSKDWEERLRDKLLHKHFDEPEDVELNAPRTTTTTTNNGVGWKEVATIGALMAGTGLGAAYMSKPAATDNEAQPPGVVDTDTNTQYQFTPLPGD